MRAYWESLGILGPVYWALGSGLCDEEIADRVHTSQENVTGCTRYLVRLLGVEDREAVVRHARGTSWSSLTFGVSR